MSQSHESPIMILAPLEHPAGQIPPTAPKGLVDILWPEPVSMAQHVGEILTQHGRTQGLWWLAALVLLGMASVLLFRLWRDRRGIVLRWRLTRLLNLLTRPQHATYSTEQLSAAAMWALAQHFGMRPAVQRADLPEAWQPLVRRLDALRFSPAPVGTAALQDVLRAMQTLSRHACPEASC